MLKPNTVPLPPMVRHHRWTSKFNWFNRFCSSSNKITRAITFSHWSQLQSSKLLCNKSQFKTSKAFITCSSNRTKLTRLPCFSNSRIGTSLLLLLALLLVINSNRITRICLSSMLKASWRQASTLSKESTISPMKTGANSSAMPGIMKTNRLVNSYRIQTILKLLTIVAAILFCQRWSNRCRHWADSHINI